MNLFKKYLMFYLFVLSLTLISACNKNPLQTYIDEANNLCDIYTPKSLKQMNLDDQGGLKEIASATRKAVKSVQFLAVFKTLSTSGYRDYYAALQPKVSKLIGKKWHCENMYKFYDFTWEKADGKKDPSGKNKKIELRITADGFIQINNKKYTYKETNSWSEILKKYLAKEDPWTTIVFVPENFFAEEDLEPLITIFSAFKVDKHRQQYREYRVSEYETLKKLGLKE